MKKRLTISGTFTEEKKENTHTSTHLNKIMITLNIFLVKLLNDQQMNKNNTNNWTKKGIEKGNVR